MAPPDSNVLKKFLVKELASISDADPDILSDYILALLKHERPDIQEWCSSQLQDFLHENTAGFIDALFHYLEKMKRGEQPVAREIDDRGLFREDRQPRRRSKSPKRNSSRVPDSKERSVRDTMPKSEKRLVLERVPEGYMTEAHITEFFKKFGPITSVEIENDRALIEFERKQDARAAFYCPDPIFNNRFVRLNFDREEQPRKQPIVLPAVTNYVAPDYQPPPRPVILTPHQQKQEIMKQKQAQLLELSKQKQGLLAAYLEQQKLLMVKLEEEGNESEKHELLSSLKAVDEKIKTITIDRPVSPDPASRISSSNNNNNNLVSRKLDRRPTTIRIQPIPEKLSDRNEEAARILFSSFGTVNSIVFEDESLLISFSIRAEAEKVLFSSQRLIY